MEMKYVARCIMDYLGDIMNSSAILRGISELILFTLLLVASGVIIILIPFLMLYDWVERDILTRRNQRRKHYTKLPF